MAKQGKHAKHGKEASSQKPGPAGKSPLGPKGKAPHQGRVTSAYEGASKSAATKDAKKILRFLGKASPKVAIKATGVRFVLR